MRILICDDDTIIVEQLKHLLKDFFKQHKLTLPEIISYSSGDALLQDSEIDADLIFLDIEMPGVDGIYVGNHIKKKKPNTIIIVVTSFAEYLDEAMRFHVFRYLSKPIDKQRLFQNLKDALQQYNTANTKIAIETKDGVFPVLISDIVCIEAIARKTIVHTVYKDFDSVENMQYWSIKLNEPCFFQTHRSFIVNLAHITDFNDSIIHLYNHQVIAYLTRRKYSEFKAKYLLYLESTR